jgi:hypothetical protein
MPGVRIHHATHINCTILIEHPGEVKSLFRTRNKGRKPKEYHIKLDNEGNCIVSETIWQRLQEAGVKNFIVLNEVADPPIQYAGLQDGTFVTPAMYKQIGDAIREVAPPGVKTYIRRHHD